VESSITNGNCAIINSSTGSKNASLIPCVNYMSNNPEPDFERLVKAVVGLWTDIDRSAYPGAMVKQIAAPTLLVRGNEDHLYSLKCAIELRDQINNAGLLNIPGAGHEVYKDTPVLFLEPVNEFLEKYSGN
jgi:pimeloyl-ACP methyl ester carboxylesterase